jgi:hypothetical protein
MLPPPRIRYLRRTPSSSRGTMSSPPRLRPIRAHQRAFRGKQADGAVEVPGFGIGEAAIVEGQGVLGIDLDRTVVVGDRAGIILLGEIDVAAVVVDVGAGPAAIIGGDWRLWIDPDRLVEVGDGAVVVLPEKIGVAAIVVGQGVIGIELERLILVGDGAIEIFFLQIAVGTVVEGERQGLAGKAPRLDHRRAGRDLLVGARARLAAAAPVDLLGSLGAGRNGRDNCDCHQSAETHHATRPGRSNPRNHGHLPSSCNDSRLQA